jgi:broad specificity phosphatase PhoE
MRTLYSLNCTIYMVRHGETEWNRNGRWQGQQDIPLSEAGRKQARLLAARFQATDQNIDMLYSSDLTRAMETADIIGRAIRKSPISAPALREIHLGTWEGHSVDEIARIFPLEWARLEAGEDVARGGGETYGAFQNRIMGWLEATAAAASGRTIVAVTHGGCIRSVLLGIRHLEWSERHLIPSIENASITSILRTPDGWKILEDADTDHLRQADSGETAQVTLDEGKIV